MRKRANAKKGRTGGSAGGAVVFALSGGLGAGKTTFAQGFLAGLGVRRRAPSPTFVIMRRYEAPRCRAHVFHIDAYRLKKPADLAALGFKEIAAGHRNIILIEWAENLQRLLPRRAVWLRFRHGRNAHERTIAKR